MAQQHRSLAITDDVILPLSSVSGSGRLFECAAVEQDNIVVITQAFSLNRLPLESSSLDIVVGICKSDEFLAAPLLSEIFRVTKPDGEILVSLTQDVHGLSSEKIRSSLERKLAIAGFLEPEGLSEMQSIRIKAKKPSWKIGSSFSLKALPKVQVNDDLDLIDEDTLLTEEDLKKRQLPLVGHCEVRTTRKACTNCTCGRADAEQKVKKLVSTMDQLNNPPSACGNRGLGDAFRCSTCPYKGLPPFKLGEKVSLPGGFLAADVQACHSPTKCGSNYIGFYASMLLESAYNCHTLSDVSVS
ncbi:hypothetical protein Cgig2_002176 [Carnegiea gigantea]|uniref:Anamorsin homolog n=1 Tax=Carnegiea gigantea TaxID=171969 RepID=A0A9Q1KT75_9CARY|nr:hypothetical protein Cgig2_002176 [Carnegiea gigantea]